MGTRADQDLLMLTTRGDDGAARELWARWGAGLIAFAAGPVRDGGGGAAGGDGGEGGGWRGPGAGHAGRAGGFGAGGGGAEMARGPGRGGWGARRGGLGGGVEAEGGTPAPPAFVGAVRRRRRGIAARRVGAGACGALALALLVMVAQQHRG